ncbi:MAG: hypothetical protein ACOC5D_03260, partial [Thermoplasmatota archaeon]
KARQLAKEMEKKAKDTAKKKKEAEKNLDKADELLKISKKIDLDFEEAEGMIDEGREKLDNKKFDEANSLINDAIKNLQQNNLEYIDEQLGHIESFLKTAGKNKKYESLRDEMEEAKELIKKDNFSEAHKKSQEITNKAEKIIKEGIKNDLKNIESLMDMVEKRGEDKDKAEEIYSDAKSKFESGEYERAIDLIGECKNILGKKIKDDLDEMIQELEKERDQLEEEKIDIREISEKLEKAKQLEKNGEYQDALDIVQETSNEIDERVKDLVNNKLNVFKEQLEEAEDIGADLGELEGIPQKVGGFIDEGNLSEANGLLDEAFEKVEDAKFQKVLKTIAESKEDFIKAKNIGADIGEPMSLLNKARDSLRGGDYRGALKWAEAGREKVKELVEEYERIKEKISEKNEYIQQLSEKIDVNFVESENILSEAEELLDQNNYEKADEKIKNLDEKIEKTAYEGLMDLIENVEVTLLTAEDIEINIDEYRSKLEESIEKTKKNDFLESAKTALKIKESLRQNIGNELNSRIENMKNKISSVSGKIDEDVEDRVNRFLEESKNSLENEYYSDSWEFITKAERELEMTQKAKAEEYYENALDLIDIVSNLEVEGINIEDLKTKIDESKKFLDNKNFTESIEKSESIVSRLNSKLDKKADDLFSEAKREVLKAKKIGINIEESREKLIECKKKIKKKKYAEAIRIAYDIRENNKKERKRRNSINEYISNVTNELSSLQKKEKTAIINDAKDVLKEAKKEVRNENYSEAKRLAETARNKIDEIKGRKAIKNQIDEIHEQMEKIKEKGIDFDGYDKNYSKIEKAEKLIENGKNKQALNSIEEARKKINNRIEKSIESKIEDIEDQLKTFKGVGIDFSESEDLLDEAKALFDDEWYWEAYSKLEEAEKSIENKRMKSKNAREELKEVKDLIQEAKNINAKVQEPENIIEKVEDAIEGNDYQYALEELELAKRKIKKAEKKRIKNILNTFRKKIEKARSKGLDIALADNIMRRAEKAMVEGDYREAINLAMQSEGEIEKIELQQKIAKRTILNANKKLKRAEEKGITVDRAKMLLSNSKRSYKEGIYVKAFDSALKSSERLDLILNSYHESKVNIDKIKEMISVFKEEDVKVKYLEDDLKRIKKKLGSGKYEKAYNLSKETINNNEKLEPLVSEFASKIENKLDELEKKGRDINKARKKIARARAVMDVENPYYLLKLVEEAKEESGIRKEKEYHELVEEVEQLIKKARKFGASVSSVKKYIKDAKKFEEENNIDKAYELIKEAQNKVEEALAPYSPELKIKVDKRPTINKWNSLDLIIKNTGKGVAKNPEITVDGAEIKDIDLPKMLKGKDELKKKLKVRPYEENIEIIVKGVRIFDNKTFDDEVELDVSEGFDYVKAEEEDTCDICGDKIDKGEEIILCSCGNMIHNECALKEKVCPNCGTDFEEVEDVEKEKEVSRRVSLGI